MGLKDLAGEAWGGDDQGGDTAEPEVENRAEVGGEASEGVVGHGGEEVEVADDRDRRRGGRKAAAARRPHAAEV